jgi:oligopeptide/dipeptide ABC transporter ATP-binding protein
MTPLLEVRDLVKEFPIRHTIRGVATVVHALDGVSLSIAPGEALAVVGESGSGKTTLARCILGLTTPTAGSIRLDDTEVARGDGAALRAFRRRVQPVFQDPYASLDPRWSVARTVREPLDAYGIGSSGERDDRVSRLLDLVGLTGRMAPRRPHELSGGQRQRVGIAAALALEPQLIVADEPTSALDVSVQAQILNLLSDLQRELGIAILLITHNLAVVEHICDRALVMYLGRLVEEAPVADLFADARHPYSQALMAAIPYPDPNRRLPATVLRGEVPSPIDPPSGCHFHTRCPVAIDVCRDRRPPMTAFGPSHLAACHVAAAAITQ